VVEGWFTKNGACSSDSNDTPDSNGRCPGACEFADVLVEQNEAVLEELRIQLLTLFLTAIVIQNTLEVGMPFLILGAGVDIESDERDGDDDDEEDDAAGIGFNPATEYIDVDALRCIDEDVDGDEPQPQA